MQVYWLTDRITGEATLVDADTVERLLGVEPGYVERCIEIDGMFENGKWEMQSRQFEHIRVVIITSLT